MEPIKINVTVEVGLKQTTLEALATIFRGHGLPTAHVVNGQIVEDEPERKAKKTQPAPAPEAPTPVVDDDDLPPDDAPAPKKTTPTEDDARQAVKAARSRGVPAKVIKDFMKEQFDIASSVECPADKRQQLIDGLNHLAA